MEKSDESTVIRTRGGARKGAGRPKAEKPLNRVDVYLYLTEEQKAALEEETIATGEDKISSYLHKQIKKMADELIQQKKEKKE